MQNTDENMLGNLMVNIGIDYTIKLSKKCFLTKSFFLSVSITSIPLVAVHMFSLAYWRSLLPTNSLDNVHSEQDDQGHQQNHAPHYVSHPWNA